MKIGTVVRNLVYKKRPGGDYSPDDENPSDGGLQGEIENPYLAARRTWNDKAAAIMADRQMWEVLCILALMIALAAVGGMIFIGSQSKFVPYVVEVDKHSQTIALGPAQRTGRADPRVVHASVASFISDIRMVTPDIALQRKAIYRVYSMLSSKDAATAKANEYLNGTDDSSPFKRAEKETVSVEISSVIPQTPDTWQVDWVETVYDRQGVMKDQPFRMRALVTVYTVHTTKQTTEDDLRNNPISTYVRDFSWSKQV
jgi:type IV secretion system protein VirB5